MTVKELIEILAKECPEAVVYRTDFDGFPLPVNGIKKNVIFEENQETILIS